MHRKNPPAVDESIAPAQGVTRGGQPLSYNRAPIPELAGWIARLYVTKVTVPDDYVISCGLFNEAPALRIQLQGQWTAETADGTMHEGRSALFFGPQTKRMPIIVKGSFTSVGALLRPGAIHSMFGLKIGDYLDRLVPATELTASTADLFDALTTEVATEGEPEDWLKELEQWFLRIIAKTGALPPDPVTSQFEMIALSDPAMSVQAAADVCAVDRRRLERLCRRDFGMAPKQVLRRARALDMASLLRGVAEPDEGDALALRYYDESHLIRDFTAFFGQSRRQFVAQPQPILTLALESRQAYRLEALKRIEPGQSRPWE